ncbi:flagellar motor stator protein MotA [Halalkalibacterium ligniniphilum]|uniref:flagellar motor stator protein MotA n=1 Tax=Halalkalibacterium ligniniphilum TaxID=1134413 RepID=UPI00034AD3FC|nr:flagellar motor stator protein MotA [Halalkalibacterium ligniniphilum]
MDKTSFIGVILGVIAIILGMVFKGTSLTVLINPAAFMIIFAGTIAAVLVAFPMEEIKRVPKLFKILFSEKKQPPTTELIEQFVEYAKISRQEGLLSLESKIKDIDDPFLQQSMRMVIDGLDPEFIRYTLNERIDAMQERHATGASIFTQAGTYAPTLGVLGAVLGLIAALGNLEDTEALGYAIAAAFVATLFGIFSGYVLWHPFANKLKRKSRKETLHKYIIVEGTISIINGVSPRAMEESLSVYLEEQEQVEYLKRSE